MEQRLAAAPLLPLQLPECRTGFSPSPPPQRPGLAARAAGTLLHRFLERWDGTAPSDALLSLLAKEQGCDDETRALVKRRIQTLSNSATWRQIATAEVVGKELPLAFLDQTGNVVERRIDRLIRIDGRDVVVDYKSGEIDDARLQRDRAQVEEYCAALRRITGRAGGGWIWYVDQDRLVAV